MPRLAPLALALNLCLPAAAQDMYVRGAFNGWGIDHPLQARGQQVFEADISMAPGYHAFKLGRKDWSAEWVIDPQGSIAVALERDYPLATQAGPHDYLFVKQSATYRFRLDLSEPAAPRLRVSLLAANAAPAVDPHAGHGTTAQLHFATHDGKTETARFSSPDPQAALRQYAHSSSAPLREPGPNYVQYSEYAELPRTRTGALAFDALFALSMHEMRQNAVSQIRDGNYNGGGPIDCACFETGEKWHYVWTRDLSYAAHLGLAMLDPGRVRNSLEFKLSGFRAGLPGKGEQIIQDTGSGGSWPVSTDRVSWAFGAQAVLDALAPAERAGFGKRALAALRNTIEADRLSAYDPADGLYSGEQSFLDWREQSYARWIVDDIASLASSKALSTNVAHYQALRLASQLAHEQDDPATAARYGQWAAALKRAINQRLWLEQDGLYSSLTGPHFDARPLRKFDWLGQSLAVLTGVADGERARRVLSRYPHGPFGAPVIYPQQPEVPVYHNRALWPFVTAYGLKAAARAGHVAAADAAYASLLRGSALNLSNMENLEWLSGQALLLDEQRPDLIGPAINSRRQLWSVGAYAGMVIENVFGLQLQAGGLHIAPFVTARLRRESFAGQAQLQLENLRLRGKTINVQLRLPPASQSEGVYQLASIRLNGQPQSARIAWDALQERNLLEIELGALRSDASQITRVTGDPYRQEASLFAPPEPQLSAVRKGKQVTLTLAGSGTLSLYRNGRLLAQGLRPGVWTDRNPGAAACYSLEARLGANSSHPSRPACLGEVQEIRADDVRVQSSRPLLPPRARFVEAAIQDWGDAGDSFSVRDIQINSAGRYALQLRYHNGANQINLGISGGVKRLRVFDAAGREVGSGIIQLPHVQLAAAATKPAYSTPLQLQLKPGRYSLRMEDWFNMSYLEANASFSAAGGLGGPSNRFDIFGLRVLRR